MLPVKDIQRFVMEFYLLQISSDVSPKKAQQKEKKFMDLSNL